MRPLARALTKNLDSLRAILRDQCLRTCAEYSDRVSRMMLTIINLCACQDCSNIYFRMLLKDLNPKLAYKNPRYLPILGNLIHSSRVGTGIF